MEDKMKRKKKSLQYPLINLLFLLLAILSIAFAGGQNSALRALLPEIAGWQLIEEPQIYSPETLFEYINGASEAYLGYDFKELIVADYQKIGSETTITLEIYDMGRPIQAFGIFSSERYPENPAIDIGIAGYLEGEVLNFVSGRYYIKLLCYNGNHQTADYLQIFAGEVDTRIKEKAELPGIFKLFPDQGKVKNSEKFIMKNFMGLDFLSNGYVVAYRGDQGEFDGLIIDCGSEEEAKLRLQKLLEFYAGEKTPLVKEGSKYHQKNPYGQHLILGQDKGYVFGFNRISDDQMPLALKLFEELEQRLRSKE